MSGWTFYNPAAIIFEIGALEKLGLYFPYKWVVLITSSSFRRRGIVDRIASALGEKLVYVLDDVLSNPDLLTLDSQLIRLRTIRPDVIVALGGGSSIDNAKTLALMLRRPQGSTLQGHFRGQVVLSKYKALPIIAIATTSGTGSEVTPSPAATESLAIGQTISD